MFAFALTFIGLTLVVAVSAIAATFLGASK